MYSMEIVYMLVQLWGKKEEKMAQLLITLYLWCVLQNMHAFYLYNYMDFSTF